MEYTLTYALQQFHGCYSMLNSQLQNNDRFHSDNQSTLHQTELFYNFLTKGLPPRWIASKAASNTIKKDYSNCMRFGIPLLEEARTLHLFHHQNQNPASQPNPKPNRNRICQIC